MSRIRINAYGISKSARLLGKYLGVKRLKINGTRYVPRISDIIINWGNGKANTVHSNEINTHSAISNAANKLVTLTILGQEGVKTPRYATVLPEEDNALWVARTALYGHSGQGIYIGTLNELPIAPL